MEKNWGDTPSATLTEYTASEKDAMETPIFDWSMASGGLVESKIRVQRS